MNKQDFIDAKTYYDKVLGCWFGKTIGGTLGAPIEGQMKEHALTGFLQDNPKGIPNDDLDLQVIWLQMLEDKGFPINADDFLEYWLDCVPYDPDEYGMARGNARRGLKPPLTGLFRNWFKHSMGCPIRSEIWACVTPGEPEIAASLAYHDAIFDHAGGESVNGEMFLAALESFAFVESDTEKLISRALSVIPVHSRTTHAICDVMQWVKDTTDWREVRQMILQEYGNLNNSQDWLQNACFIMLGWLLGEGDFKQSLLTAINCGYDTDCTGASLGALLGIIYGYEALPFDWTDAVGTELAVGAVNIDAPADIYQLTHRVCSLAEKALVTYGANIRIRDHKNLITNSEACKAISKIDTQYSLAPDKTVAMVGPIEVVIDYQGLPTVSALERKTMKVRLSNMRQVPLAGKMRLSYPGDWTVEPLEVYDFHLGSCGEVVNFTLDIQPSKISVRAKNPLYFLFDFHERPPEALSVSLVGESIWMFTGPYSDLVYVDDLTQKIVNHYADYDLMESLADLEMISVDEYKLPLSRYLKTDQASLALGLTYLYSPNEQELWVALPCTKKTTAWVNGQKVLEAPEGIVIRPAAWHYVVYEHIKAGYALVPFKKGWNNLLVRFESSGGVPEGHFLLARHGEEICKLAIDVENTMLPWW